MAGGVKISLIPDVSKVLAATDDVGEAFADVADSLDDMAREAQRAGKATADGIDKGTDSATDSVEDLGKSFKDLTRDVSKATKQVGDDLGDSTRDGTRRASASVDEFKDEAKSNFSEVASSFSGGIDSAADLVQGTLGGLAGSLVGPAGLAAGVLAGVGGAMYASFQANAEASSERVSTMYDDMIESGSEFLSQQFVQESLAAIIGKTDDARISWDKLQEAVKVTGLSQETVALAFAGDAAAGAQFNAALVTSQQQLNTEIDKGLANSDQRNADLQVEKHNVDEVASAWTGAAGELGKAKSQADLYKSAIDQSKTATDGAKTAIGGVLSEYERVKNEGPVSVKVDVDLSPAERSLRNWRPVVTVEGQFVAGRAVK